MDTTRIVTREHRQAGRGRRAFWVAVALGAVMAVGWASAAQAQREFASKAHGRAGRSIATFGAELRNHAGLLRLAGVAGPQVERIAALVDERSALFAEIEGQHTALKQRVADAVAAETLDMAEFADTLAEARTLANRTLDESFDLVAAVAGELTPAQRAELVRHWSNQ
jgi:hypothetical protein